MEKKDLSLLDHLKELRVRLLRSFIGVVVIFLPLIFFSNEIYELASSPLQELMPENSSMIATQVASPFLSPLKLTFYLSLMISLPYFFSEMWRFIAPGLYKTEKRFALGLTLSSILLFYLGILFAYILVFPLVFGSLTCVVVFALVRVIGGTTAGLIASLMFAISLPILLRGMIGWYKSEPFGLFLSFIAIYLLLSAIKKNKGKISFVKLVLDRILSRHFRALSRSLVSVSSSSMSSLLL